MVNHSSATARVETPHERETTQITISDALKRRAHSEFAVVLISSILLLSPPY